MSATVQHKEQASVEQLESRIVQVIISSSLFVSLKSVNFFIALKVKFYSD